jgi:hypothetical protein
MRRARLWVKAAVLLALLLCVVPASAHDWYTDLKVPGTEMLCCGQKDCHPVPDQESPGGEELKVLIEGTWYVVAAQLGARHVLAGWADPCLLGASGWKTGNPLRHPEGSWRMRNGSHRGPSWWRHFAGARCALLLVR